jgi:ribokinase
MEAAAKIRQDDQQIIIATLGADGLTALVGKEARTLPAQPVTAIDTTGAGDCFCGALTARLAAGEAIWDALEYAQSAAAISVTRPGAAQSMPTRAEVANTP